MKAEKRKGSERRKSRNFILISLKIRFIFFFFFNKLTLPFDQKNSLLCNLDFFFSLKKREKKSKRKPKFGSKFGQSGQNFFYCKLLFN